MQFEYQEICTAIEEERIMKQTNWFDLVRTPGMRKRMRIIIAIAFFSQWSVNGLAYDVPSSPLHVADICPRRSYYLNKVFATIGSKPSLLELTRYVLTSSQSHQQDRAASYQRIPERLVGHQCDFGRSVL